MSKQHTQTQTGRQQPADKDQKSNQPRKSQDRLKNPDDREDLESTDEGGEESKHGRKQKGNVEDS